MRAIPFVLFMNCLIAQSACLRADQDSPARLLAMIERAAEVRDTGAIMVLVDKEYQDDRGGAGRLEDDLRRLFAVYGELKFRCEDITTVEDTLKANAVVEGKNLRYAGPLHLSLEQTAAGWMVRAGLLTEMRAIIQTLRERRLALERGMVNDMADLLSPEYQGRPGGRNEYIQRFQSEFASINDTALVVHDLEIVVTGENAQVTQSYLLITHVNERTIERRDRERLELRKEGTRWRFLAGLG